MATRFVESYRIEQLCRLRGDAAATVILDDLLIENPDMAPSGIYAVMNAKLYLTVGSADHEALRFPRPRLIDVRRLPEPPYPAQCAHCGMTLARMDAERSAGFAFRWHPVDGPCCESTEAK